MQEMPRVPKSRRIHPSQRFEKINKTSRMGIIITTLAQSGKQMTRQEIANVSDLTLDQIADTLTKPTINKLLNTGARRGKAQLLSLKKRTKDNLDSILI